MLKRLFVLALAIVALGYSAPAQASAPTPRPPGTKGGPVVVKVSVFNDSTTCVWVSVGYSNFYMPWSWMHEAHNTARFLRPHTGYDFMQGTASIMPVPHPWEVKVEATFMTNSDCTGEHAKELTRINKGIIAQENYGTIAHAGATLRGDSKATYDIQGPYQASRR